MSLNDIPPKTVDSNSKSEMHKLNRKFEFTPFECINYSKFDEMRKKLDFFYNEISNSLTDKTIIDNENVKKGFFKSLEVLLVEISLIKDEKLRITKIDEVFNWFKKKVSLSQKVKIDFKSSKKKFEKYVVPKNYKKLEAEIATENQTKTREDGNYEHER